MLCRQVPVSKLGKAVTELEKSEESGGRTDSSSAGALFQYLLGKGRPFYTAATKVLEERQQEFLREKLVNDLSTTAAELKGRLANGLGPALAHLSDAEKFLSEASGVVNKKKGQQNMQGIPSLTSTQKQLVQVEIDEVTAAVHKLIVMELNKNVIGAMQLCEEARNNDGYVNMAPDSQEGSPMLGLVKLPELQARLQGEYLTNHTIWTTIPVPPLEKAKWQTHQKMSDLMYRVLASTLVSMPAYTNIGLELPPDGLWPDWEGLHQ